MVDPIEAGIRFMETAARNWREFPILSRADFADVGQALELKIRRAREEGARAMQEAAAKEVHSFKDKRKEDGTDDWFAFVDIAMCVSGLNPAEIVKGIGQ